jgi:hypothetical protein
MLCENISMDIEDIVILPDHYNPVKYGYVEVPGDWPYSSGRFEGRS